MDEYEIIMDGVFGLEINSLDFSRELTRAAGKDITIKASSPGGSVSEGTAIKNSLRSYMRMYPNAKVRIEVVGWAQSAMTYVMAAKGIKVAVSPDTFYLYHNPSSFAFGDHAEMARQTEFLNALSETYAREYSERSGKSIEEVRAEMDAETYFIGQQIIDAGFADEMMDADETESTAQAPVLAEMGREQMRDAIGRLAAAAYGKPQSKPAPATTPEQEIEPGDTNMSKPITTETDVSMETKRAQAWMAATKAKPEMAEALEKSFTDGASVAYFEGIQAAAIQAKGAVDNAAASAGSVPPVVTDSEAVATAAADVENRPQTPGMTGEMAEV